jgi:RNA polymerase sigma-70 factor (family 1)
VPLPIAHNEKELLTLLKEGQQEAFTQLYHLYSERIYLNVLKLVKQEQVAQEILQDIFIILWEKRDTIDIQTSFRSYLFRIGENKVIDFYRKARRDQSLYAYIKAAATEHYTHIEEALLNRENAELLQKAVNSLPAQRKQVFELCKLQGTSYQEVSSALGISPSTINDHIVKATRAIRQHIYANGEIHTALLLFSVFQHIK